MALVVNLCCRSCIRTKLLPGCKWIEVTILTAVLVSHINRQLLVVETYAGCKSVSRLPVGIICRGGVDCSLRRNSLVAVCALLEHRRNVIITQAERQHTDRLVYQTQIKRDRALQRLFGVVIHEVVA